MNNLTGAQRSWLFRRAHKLNPVIIVGQNGLTESVVNAAREALEAHELIKVKFNDFKGEKKDLTGKLALDTEADIIRIVGNTAVLFKFQKDSKKRKITPPGIV